MDGRRRRDQTAALAREIAWRYLRGRKSRLLGGTGRVALVATAIGTLAMTIAMALMTGYRTDLLAKIVGGSAAVIAYPLSANRGGVDADQEAALRALPGVSRVAVVAYGQGSLSSGSRPGGIEVTLRGVRPADVAVARAAGVASGGSASDGSAGSGLLLPNVDLGGPEAPAAVLGEELARRLGVGPGDPVRLTLLALGDGRARFSYASLRVADTFVTGFAEYDEAWAVVDLAVLERLGGGSVGAGRLVEVAVVDLETAPAVAAAVEPLLGDRYLVTDWRRLNGELFTALQLQQIVLFGTLGLIVLVSTFNVASTLVVLVRERQRDVGVLAALGLPPGPLRSIFVLYGLALGAAGTFLGVGLGSLVAFVFDRFELIRFDPEVAAIYFIRAVRFRVELGDLVAITVFSLLVTLLACWLPSRRATRVDPSTALRAD